MTKKAALMLLKLTSPGPHRRGACLDHRSASCTAPLHGRHDGALDYLCSSNPPYASRLLLGSALPPADSADVQNG